MDKFDTAIMIAEVASYVNKEVNYLDALVYYAEKNNIEMEVLASVVKKNQALKAKLYEDCERVNLVEKVIKLPV